MGKNYIDIPIKEDSFNYGDKEYNCSRAIERDMRLIIQEAETSHRKEFDELYDRNTLEANKVRIFFDETKTPVYGMILYFIHQKKDNYWRCACGSYYPFSFLGFIPHPYQASICW